MYSKQRVMGHSVGSVDQEDEARWDSGGCAFPGFRCQRGTVRNWVRGHSCYLMVTTLAVVFPECFEG